MPPQSVNYFGLIMKDALVFTIFFSLMSMTVSAETDAERLDRLEGEIKELREKQATAESVWSKYNMRLFGRIHRMERWIW